MLSQVERCKDRLLSIGAESEPARRQIVSSVMQYWHEKPGVGVNILDKLLNYTILTPISVIMWALSDHLGKGEGLVLSHVFELVSNTVSKVTKRVRQIVIARNQPNLAVDQATVLDETLGKERDEVNRVFAVIEDALVGVASGSADDVAESVDQDERGEAMLRSWGGRWLRVFRRRMAVEESWVMETIEQGRRRAEAMEGVDEAQAEDAVATGLDAGDGVETANGEADVDL